MFRVYSLLGFRNPKKQKKKQKRKILQKRLKDGAKRHSTCALILQSSMEKMTGEDVKNITNDTTETAGATSFKKKEERKDDDDDENANEKNKKRKLLSLLERRMMGGGGEKKDGNESEAAKAVARATTEISTKAAQAGAAPGGGGTNDDDATKTEMKKTFVCEANDCVHFHLFEGDKGEEKTFEPEFAHQVFREDETIYGYSEDLSVDVL